MKLTPWFDGETKPAHVGVYEREHNFFYPFSYWDGKEWKASSYDAETAIARSKTSAEQRLHWRGILKDE